MNNGEIKTVEQVWDLIDQGKTVYWNSEAYKVYVEYNPQSSPYHNSEARRPVTKDESMLTVRCISNYFGSVLNLNELSQLFTKD